MFGNYQYSGGPLGNFFAQNTPQSLLAGLFGGSQAPAAQPQLQLQPPPVMQAPPIPAQVVQQMATPPSPPMSPQPGRNLTAEQIAMGTGGVVGDAVGDPGQVQTFPLLPQAPSSPAGASQLLDTIAGPESGGRYDVQYGGSTVPNLANMTLDQVQAHQKAHGRKTGSSAIGKFQIISKTMAGLKKDLKLTGDELFTPELQDRMGMELLKRRGYDKFLAGDLSRDAFASNLSKEWAGLPKDAGGASYYAGDAMNNAAGIGWDEVAGALDVARGQGQAATPPGAPQIPPAAMPAMAGQAPAQAPAASPYDALRQQIMNPSQPEGMSQGKRTALGVMGALARWGGMPDTASAVLGAQPAGGQQMTLPQQIAAMSSLNKMEMERLKQQGQQTWLGTLDPQQRALAEAGFGSQVAQQQIAGMAPQEPVVPEAPKVVDVGGQDAVWDPQQGAFVPAPTAGMPEIPPEAAGGAEALTIPQRVTAANTLSDNFRQEAKPVDEVLTRYDQVRDIDPVTADATQDRTLIVALSRALDPNSAVMEGEAESVQRAAGGQGRWANTIRKTWAGEELTASERTSIIREMSRLAGGAAKKQNKLWNRYSRRAERYGLDPRNVVDEEPYQYTPWGQQEEPAAVEPAAREPGQQYESQKTLDGTNYFLIDGEWYTE